MSVSEKETNDFVTHSQDFDLADALMKKQNKSPKKNKNSLNEFGDKVGEKEICQGILLILGVLGTLYCLCVRGCQEYKKHHDKHLKKANAIQIHVHDIR